jgi:hypothetical protein
MVACRSPLLRALLNETLAQADRMMLEPVDSASALKESVLSDGPQVVLASPALLNGGLHPPVTDIVRSGARVLVVCDSSEKERHAPGSPLRMHALRHGDTVVPRVCDFGPGTS